jgi:hypothetical protein
VTAPVNGGARCEQGVRPWVGITPAGATFDQALKTPRYAWGKALNLSGGIRIGKP